MVGPVQLHLLINKNYLFTFNQTHSCGQVVDPPDFFVSKFSFCKCIDFVFEIKIVVLFYNIILVSNSLNFIPINFAGLKMLPSFCGQTSLFTFNILVFAS